MAADNYSETQDVRASEYLNAWKGAPKSFIKKAAALGLAAEPEEVGDVGVMEHDEHLSSVSDPGHTPSFYIPDMAEALDTHVDRMVEKYDGTADETLVRAIAEDMKLPMKIEIEKNRALMLGLVVMYLIKSETNNILARCHQLLHAIPRLANEVGFTSMRQSAKACGVSPEWIRRGRDKWCDDLGLPIPVNGCKTEEAKARYSHNGKTNHWRRQKFRIKPIQTICLKPNQTPTPILKLPRLAMA